MAQALTPGRPGHPPNFATAVLAYHMPRPSHSPPNPETHWEQSVRTPIFDFQGIKRATWPTWKPWQIFEAERVVDVEHGIHEDDLKRFSDDEWLQRFAGEHRWDCLASVLASPGHAPSPPRELAMQELKSLNDRLRGALRGVMDTAFAGDPFKPEYLGMHVRASAARLLRLNVSVLARALRASAGRRNPGRQVCTPR
jgi:hypothetical protein